ncbi:MAG TPA: Vms1/Ankzf1 family peptidyl-tRNA hydrolase [Thermoleophilaceae bacterium]|nr:Vms1/Ankzf1 family peptidyl-tRNA hydrolase [Thermoleophilaceae bacterium]
MNPAAIESGRVRRLSERRADRRVVLSLYLDLDPSEFATPPARSSAVRSLIDEAGKQIEGADLGKDEVKALRSSLERAKSFLEADLPTEGVHSVAVFAAEPLDLFETLALAQSLPTRIAIGRAPLVGPLVVAGSAESYGVVLVNREMGRLLRGDGSVLREVADVRTDVHGQHQQGGWSQPRYQRTIENEVQDHLREVAGMVSREFDRQPFQRLVIGGPEEVLAGLRSELRTDLAERLAGYLDVDVSDASPDDVLAAMRPALEAQQHRREEEVLERLGAPLTASGTAAVLKALNERRVETLLIDEARREPAAVCTTCGSLAPAGIATCPADGSPLEQVEDLKEPALELALRQEARVMPVRVRPDELRAAGGIAALLRF